MRGPQSFFNPSFCAERSGVAESARNRSATGDHGAARGIPRFLCTVNSKKIGAPVPQFVLASASPARLAVLRSAGVDPLVRVSGVDEDAVQASLGADARPGDVVTGLAKAKALAVVPLLVQEGIGEALVVGCDSMLLLGGELQGKPATAQIAKERWGRMAGNTAELLTGHSVIKLTDGVMVDEAHDFSSTLVRFGTPTEDEINAYISTEEPLRVAGGFTLDGLGGWFVDGIEGDPSSVIGIGLPLLRRLLAKMNIPVWALWNTPSNE
jgi:septum formation protein